MSLEEALQKNTQALEKNSALMERMLGAAAAGKPAAAGAAAAAKPAAAAAAKPAGKPAAAAKPKLTVEMMAEKATAFLKTGDKELRDQRKLEMGEIIAYFGVERFTLIPEENYAEALKALDTFTAGERPAFLEADNDGSGEGDEDGAMV